VEHADVAEPPPILVRLRVLVVHHDVYGSVVSSLANSVEGPNVIRSAVRKDEHAIVVCHSVLPCSWTYIRAISSEYLTNPLRSASSKSTITSADSSIRRCISGDECA